jgi:CRISPR-associated protein Cmr1
VTTERTYKLTALTDLWTGDAQGKPERLITTGLLGSIRWWFEVLVRGLGGSACDPTLDGNRCPNGRKQPTDAGHHCVACELFGCTNWARKFRFEVLDANGTVKVFQIKKDNRFTLRFTELRPIRPEEWALLDLTLRLIADYGAIGGKTVYKPSDEPSRQDAPHHRDYGLIELQEGPDLKDVNGNTEDVLRSYVTQDGWRKLDHDRFAWASLEHFWCVKGRYLARKSSNDSAFNRVIGRKQPKRQAQQLDVNNNINRWLAGSQQESKKVFSFKEPEEARRTFGFVKPGVIDFRRIKSQLRSACPGFQDHKFEKSLDILKRLLPRRAGGSP